MSHDPVISDPPKSSLRIALVNTSDEGGGAERSTYLLLQAFRQLGHSARLYVGVKRGSDPDVVEIPRVRPFPGILRFVKWLEERYGWQYLYQPWFRRLDRLIGSVDVVHYHNLWYGRQGYADITALPRLTKKYPSVLTLRDWWMLTGHCAHPALGCERWKNGCGNCPDLGLAPAIPKDGTQFNFRRKLRSVEGSQIRVITVSEAVAADVKLSPIFRGKPVHTVHNGIDETAFFPRDQQQVRSELGLPLDAFIVLIAGQSVEGTSGLEKGAGEYAIEALHSSAVQPFLLAVGKSSARSLAKYGGPGRAVPFQTDPHLLAAYYCAADVVVVASLWESFGRVAAEAQMCGVPVATFATGGLPEIVQHQQTGLVVERLNSLALGEAIRRLCSDPELRRQYGRNAAEQALARFSNHSIAEQYLAHYRDEIALRKAASGLKR